MFGGIKTTLITGYGCYHSNQSIFSPFNPLNPELNPICYLLALLGAHHFLHVSRIRAWGRSPAEIVGSNPTGGMDICLL